MPKKAPKHRSTKAPKADVKQWGTTIGDNGLLCCNECGDPMVISGPKFCACPNGHGRLIARVKGLKAMKEELRGTMRSMPCAVRIGNKSRYKIAGIEGQFTRLTPKSAARKSVGDVDARYPIGGRWKIKTFRPVKAEVGR